jgi:ribonucleoside-diphosphate reductase alpha chain
MNKELLDYFSGDELAAGVWKGKYALDKETNPNQMHQRMAKEFARIEKEYQKKETSEKTLSSYGENRADLNEDSIYEMFKDFKYIVPQGSIMSTLGTDLIASLSNCWVVESPFDSYSGIHKTDGDLIGYYKRRGGCGADISNLRPNKTKTNNTAKSSTGAVSFMNRFSNTTREVAMNGRRGALMLSIDVRHPDVVDFIKIKRDLTQVTGANISVRISDEFMKAVEADEDFILRFPCDWDISNEELYGCEYNTLNTFYETDGNIKYYRKIKAKEYWNEIIKSARDNAEPGLMYWDSALNYDPAAVYEQYKPICTNPCGEQFLNANDSCRLMATNLFSFVLNPFMSNASIDEDKLYSICYEALRLGDSLVDLEAEYIQRIIDKVISDPEPEEIKRQELELWIKSKAKALAGRRVGLGITALGDMLAALGLKYDSDEALGVIDRVMYIKMKAELDATIDLSVLRGHFDGWNADLEENGNKFYKFIAEKYPEQSKRMKLVGRRNSNWSTVAPTGSVSILTQTSSGVEPLFMPYYMRRKKVNPNDKNVKIDFVDQNGDNWEEFAVMHQKFKDWIYASHPKICNIEALSKLELNELFEKSPWYKSTANDIDWLKRVDIQSVLQKYTTNAISSTINLPSTVTYEDVSNIYLHGWKKGLKGQTVYVDGSRSGVLVDSSKEIKTNFEYRDAVKRPKQLSCDIHSTQSKGKKWNILVGLLEDKPYEVFIVDYFTDEKRLNLVKKARGKYDLHKGKELYSENVTSEMSDEQAAITRLTSTSLRHGADIKYVVEQLNKCEGDLYSFTKSLARTLKKYIPDGTKAKETCPDCGGTNVVYQEGCKICLDCGNGKC